jgi:phosphoglycerate-specific signal transduction histidine kinase
VKTGSYNEAVARIKMAVIHRHHPDVKLDRTQDDLIQVKLLSAVGASHLG